MFLGVDSTVPRIMLIETMVEVTADAGVVGTVFTLSDVEVARNCVIHFYRIDMT